MAKSHEISDIRLRGRSKERKGANQVWTMPTYDRSSLQVATAAFNKILQVSNARFWDNGGLQPATTTLFHYTTSDGLRGIIKENCLHASAVYFLNDFSEVEYGCGILDEVFADWQASHTNLPNSLYTRLIQELRELFHSDVSERKRRRSIYVASFCKTDNLLSQWRAYGQAGGYSIGFPVSARTINVSFRPEPNTYTAELIQVEYNRPTQVAKCTSLLDKLQSILDDGDLARAMLEVALHPGVGYADIRDVIEELFLDLIVGFKHEAFQEEQECRIVVCPRRLRKQGTDDGGRTRPPVYFRSSNGAIVPYVRLVPTKGSLPIQSIRCGPSLDRKRAGVSIEMLLEAEAFHDVAVYGSDIPVRL